MKITDLDTDTDRPMKRNVHSTLISKNKNIIFSLCPNKQTAEQVRHKFAVKTHMTPENFSC